MRLPSSGSSSGGRGGSASTTSSTGCFAGSTRRSWGPRPPRDDLPRCSLSGRGRAALRGGRERRRQRALHRGAHPGLYRWRRRAERKRWREAATASGDEDLAVLYGEIVESPPGAWLLRPLRVLAGATAELIVSTPEGLRFVAGLPEGPLSASGLGDLPYAAFGDLRVEKLRLEGGSPTVAIAKARRRQSEEELLGWIRSSAALIARYFGRFPADGALLLVLPAPGDQIHGRCRGTGGASIIFFLGTDLDAAEARRSWELVHELVHLGFPSLPRRHHWAEEGLATYVEPIARARVGELRADEVGGALARGLPQGLPVQGDEGLDRTHTWGRTYWGGALFWLLADVEIRERTGNRSEEHTSELQ